MRKAWILSAWGLQTGQGEGACPSNTPSKAGARAQSWGPGDSDPAASGLARHQEHGSWEVLDPTACPAQHEPWPLPVLQFQDPRGQRPCLRGAQAAEGLCCGLPQARVRAQHRRAAEEAPEASITAPSSPHHAQWAAVPWCWVCPTQRSFPVCGLSDPLRGSPDSRQPS